ncbi:MAG: heparinase II/III-family protein [Chloroflexaceae bacterium]|jgi:hypothetical protein|nr:heparinase II/III-family protein [Chloroflexaceae bacterium]
MPPTDSALIADILRNTSGVFPFPTLAERERWQPLAATAVGRDILNRAETALVQPTPPIPATAFLAFQRDGAREPYETPHEQRRTRLILFALAECLQGQGRFLDAALDEIWAICEESSWVIPSHAADYALGLPDPNQPLVDLYSAITAVTLAEADYLLNDALHLAARARIRHEVSRRSTHAFLARNDYPWLGYGPKKINNWMPVCAGGSAIAALYLEPDVERLAAVLAKALEGIGRYLATFGDDGGTPEGVGYWEKGMFFVAALGELLAARTNGQIDLLAHPRLRQIARFPARMELSPGWFVPFSDTGLDRRPQFALLHFLARRYNLPELAQLDQTSPAERVLTNRGAAEKLRDLFWYGDEAAAPHESAQPTADFFPNIQWFIARANAADPNGLVLAAKGGHNAEPHNQNDVGSFVVHWQGETLLADLGAMRYTRDTFRPATRYTLLANRSLGHNVPLVNGQEQIAGPGGSAWARWEVQPTSDTFALDLAPAYPPAADLLSLERRLTMQRVESQAVVALCDKAVFRSGAGSFASVLISLMPVHLVEPGCLLVVGAHGRLQVQFDPDQLEVGVERIPAVDLRGGPRDVNRVTLRCRVAALTATIALQILPLTGADGRFRSPQ